MHKQRETERESEHTLLCSRLYKLQIIDRSEDLELLVLIELDCTRLNQSRDTPRRTDASLGDPSYQSTEWQVCEGEHCAESLDRAWMQPRHPRCRWRPQLTPMAIRSRSTRGQIDRHHQSHRDLLPSSRFARPSSTSQQPVRDPIEWCGWRSTSGTWWSSFGELPSGGRERARAAYMDGGLHRELRTLGGIET